MGSWSTEEIIVLVFLGLISVVYILSFGILVRWSSAWKTYKFKPLQIAVLGTAAIGIGCFIYGALEPLRIETTFVKFASTKIKTQPIRIVHLTDLHCDGMPRTEKRLPEIVRSLHPDLVVFTGDAANNMRGLQDFQTCMSAISKFVPVFGVYGNHDARSGRGFDTFQNTGIQKLDCTSKSITIKGNEIWLAGAAVDGDGYAADVLSKAPKDAFSIYLFHYPSGLKVALAHHIDFFLAGHTHGGQIRLPFYGALVTNSEMGKKFEYGYYKVGDTHMNVSRGVGMIGIPVRFLAPPEVAVIDVVPAAQ